MPSGDKTSDVPSKYQPLFDLLAAPLIGGPLPETAVLQTHWWRGKRYDHVRAWRALGWRAHGSAAERRVRFTRDAEEGVG